MQLYTIRASIQEMLHGDVDFDPELYNELTDDFGDKAWQLYRRRQEPPSRS